MTHFKLRQKILIIDDHPATRKLLEDILKKEFDVSCAQNGTEAIEHVQNIPDFDLILLDIIMPEMDGYEVCERLKSSAQSADIPIIFLILHSKV